MDWGVIAQSVFFMAIALLAVVVTIFVFSASLLGRAVEAYKRQKRTLIQQGRDYFARQVSLAEQRLKRFESSSERSSIKQDEDERAYEEAIEKKREFKNASKNIEKGLNVFRLSGGAVYPSCFFLSSIFFSSLAWGIAATDEPSFRIGGWGFQSIPFIYAFVILAVILIGFGIYRIYFSLRSIQDITVTSEEVALSSYIEAFKIAQRELEQEHKPELQLTLIQPKSPFKIKKGENFSVEVKAGLSKGEIARQTFAVIAIPEGFELNVREHWTPFGVDRHPGYEGYRSTPARDLLKPTWHGYYADIKCPTDLGKYTFWYWAICEGYATEDLSFQVNVV